MRYVSTRGDAPILDFADTLLAGLASDGGLYVPQSWPQLSAGALSSFAELSYAEVATQVLLPFVDGSISENDLAAMTDAAYATFDHPDVVPISRLGDLFLGELYWGPTCSFKDVALQLIGRLFEHELDRRATSVTIVGATSGDTGSAAIEACRDRAGIELVMLHPAGRVSEIQRLQMTTVTSPNIHNVAIEGTFDDCQDLVKAMFGDSAFRERQRLAAVNSINWARVAAQTVYYVTSALRVGAGAPTSFCVPTGNFGNILSASIARRMGAPIDELVIASNHNDILTRTHENGVMAIDTVRPSTSPAMDIQVSSNFERLLFELGGRRGLDLGEQMREFRATGSLSLDEAVVDELRAGFGAGRASESDVHETMRAIYETTGRLIDPHTAVGVHVARRRPRADSVPMVVMATAHPAKFGDVVLEATGVDPELPAPLADLHGRPERCVTLPNELGVIMEHVAEVAGS